MNVFNDGNGWAGLGAVVQKHQLVIDGDGDDAVLVNALLNGFWNSTGSTVSNNGHTYVVHDAITAAAQLLVDTRIVRDVGPSPQIELSDIANGNGGFVIQWQRRLRHQRSVCA